MYYTNEKRMVYIKSVVHPLYYQLPDARHACTKQYLKFVYFFFVNHLPGCQAVPRYS
jgi:hypothetical protein